MDFSQENSGFILKPRKPFTRSQQLKGKMLAKPLIEKLSLEREIPEFPPAKVEPVKKRKGKEPIQEKGEVEMLQEQLRASQNEAIELKILFEILKKDISKQLDF